MARLHLKSVLSEDEQDLNEIWEWYVLQNMLIGDEAVNTLDALLSGSASIASRYFGKTRDELDEFFAYQRSELGQVTMLILLAAAEAALRVDYIVRIIENKKDAVSKQFSEIYKLQKLEVGLDDQILEIWKENSATPEIKAAIGESRGALRLRNWLAHGRYWKPKLGREYDPQNVFELCDELLKFLGIR